MTNQELAQDDKTVDVTQPQSHHRVQCVDVKLVSSTLKPLDPEKEKLGESRITFKIRVDVHENLAFGLLHTYVVYVASEPGEPLQGCWLSFNMVGTFEANEEMPLEELGDFARMYTLSILWPYAREYASDQFRRAGESADTLPIINPQTLTEKLVKSDLVEVVIHSEEETG